MLTDHLLQRLDQLLDFGKVVMATAYSTGGQYNIDYVKDAPMAGFRSAVLSFIERTYGLTHPHYGQFEHKTKSHHRKDAEAAIAILEAIRDEIAGGWLVSIKHLVSAELFADFIDMADHLLETGYKDPAAVMGGSVLEEHLRQLCHKGSIDVQEDRDGKSVSRKADRLNAELAKANIYTKLDQKLVTAWLDLRNNAAHGKYDAYTAEQVRQMLMGVTEFMARVSR
jgi:hypothetical protein